MKKSVKALYTAIILVIIASVLCSALFAITEATITARARIVIFAAL